MSIDKLKTKFFTGAWLTDVKHYFTKINEIIDYLNGVGTSGDGSYKVYTAVLNQGDEDAPIATVYANTIGNIVWTRTGVGQYYGTLTNAFPTGRLWFSLNTSLVFNANTVIQESDINSVNVTTTDETNTPVDSYLSACSIEIRVYN